MFSLFICHPCLKANCHRMPRTPSSTPPGSPGTPISDRSMSPQHQPATASPLNPLQNGIQQTATPPLSPRRAPSPRRPASPRGPRAHSPRGPPPPDPNLVDTSRPPPMRQPPAAQQVRGDKDRHVLTLLIIRRNTRFPPSSATMAPLPTMVVVALPTMVVVALPIMEVLCPPSPHLDILHSTSTLLRILSPPLRFYSAKLFLSKEVLVIRRRWQSLIVKKHREVEELIPHQELTELLGLGRGKGNFFRWIFVSQRYNFFWPYFGHPGIATTESSPLDVVLQDCAGPLLEDHALPGNSDSLYR